MLLYLFQQLYCKILVVLGETVTEDFARPSWDLELFYDFVFDWLLPKVHVFALQGMASEKLALMSVGLGSGNRVLRGLSVSQGSQCILLNWQEGSL